MNRVAERCVKDSNAKFHYAAKYMFAELKYLKIFLYVLNVVPVIICFLPSSSPTIKLICSCISFGLTLINEVAGGLLSGYKEKAIMAHQLFEAGITGSSFSKIEYDRESTNDLNELSIRKGIPKLKKTGRYPSVNVPGEITDDYSYLYLCRISAAKTRYLLSRMFFAYVLAIIGIAVVFIAVNFTRNTTGAAIYYVVCFWPLIIPIIRNAVSCRKCSRYCVKICADIDNFFADGDTTVERLARFYYYVQNIEFEMMLARPIIFNFTNFLFKRGVNVLTGGVTHRFIEAISELKRGALIKKGVIATPHGKGIITQKEYDIEALEAAHKKGAKAAKEEKKEAAIAKKEPAKNEKKEGKKVRHAVIEPRSVKRGKK